ncbi:hypothetical protein BV20DRAFT_1054675 [Pilatotrama ljubarskyi]|nr:hypothetical protein BV20DRAFT_1054675 [Pilatotrama ljubarskyi]
MDTYATPSLEGDTAHPVVKSQATEEPRRRQFLEGLDEGFSQSFWTASEGGSPQNLPAGGESGVHPILTSSFAHVGFSHAPQPTFSTAPPTNPWDVSDVEPYRSGDLTVRSAGVGSSSEFRPDRGSAGDDARGANAAGVSVTTASANPFLDSAGRPTSRKAGDVADHSPLHRSAPAKRRRSRSPTATSDNSVVGDGGTGQKGKKKAKLSPSPNQSKNKNYNPHKNPNSKPSPAGVAFTEAEKRAAPFGPQVGVQPARTGEVSIPSSSYEELNTYLHGMWSTVTALQDEVFCSAEYSAE